MNLKQRTVILLGAPGLPWAGYLGAAQPPNGVIIRSDAQGYEDLNCFGSPNIKTPRIDNMATKGRTLTRVYVGAPVCTRSRADLRTGCFAERVSMVAESKFGVFLTGGPKELDGAEAERPKPQRWSMPEVRLRRVLMGRVMNDVWHLGVRAFRKPGSAL